MQPHPFYHLESLTYKDVAHGDERTENNQPGLQFPSALQTFIA